MLQLMCASCCGGRRCGREGGWQQGMRNHPKPRAWQSRAARAERKRRMHIHCCCWRRVRVRSARHCSCAKRGRQQESCKQRQRSRRKTCVRAPCSALPPRGCCCCSQGSMASLLRLRVASGRGMAPIQRAPPQRLRVALSPLLPPTRLCSPSAGSSGLAGTMRRNETTSWPSHCKDVVGWFVRACVSKAREARRDKSGRRRDTGRTRGKGAEGRKDGEEW